jgi:hypothetical protein
MSQAKARLGKMYNQYEIQLEDAGSRQRDITARNGYLEEKMIDYQSIWKDN